MPKCIHCISSCFCQFQAYPSFSVICRVVTPLPHPPPHRGAFLINCLFVGGEFVIVEFHTFYMQILKRNIAYLKNTSAQWKPKQSHWHCRGIYRETVTVCKELYFCLLVDPRSSLTETKSSRKESSFPAEMPLIKSVGAANWQSPVIPREFVALYHRNTKIRMRSNERENDTFERRLIFSSCLNDKIFDGHYFRYLMQNGIQLLFYHVHTWACVNQNVHLNKQI